MSEKKIIFKISIGILIFFIFETHNQVPEKTKFQFLSYVKRQKRVKKTIYTECVTDLD